jgi:hypothetical protein
MTYLTKAMGDRHEADAAKWFSGRRARGSGNQFNNPADGRQSRYRNLFAFAWDCKSTRGASLSVSRKGWAKLRDQAGGERPMMPLRFYDTDTLQVGLDLAVVDMDDLRELVTAVEDLRVQVDALLRVQMDYPPPTGGPHEMARGRSQVTPPALEDEAHRGLP